MSASVSSHLLAPGTIGRLSLRNRIVVTAMGVNLAEQDGSCGERMIAYHAQQARGGAALIITGATGVALPTGTCLPRQTSISDDSCLAGLSALVQAVHAHGARLALQLQHAGLNSVVDMAEGRPLWTPSLPAASASDAQSMFLPQELAELAPATGKMPAVTFKIPTIDDIRQVVALFAAAAVRARKAGADAVEIHGAHGYLLGSFLSAYRNKRTDEYGGSLENRARFLLETIRAVKAAVGDDLAILCKLDSREVGSPGGITLEDALVTARMAQEAGADAITVTAYHNTDRGILHSASHTPHELAVNLPFAAAIKAAVRIPVIASGRVEPEVGDAAIAAGKLDFLAMGRKLLADPELPNKLAAGRAEDIRPCIYCYTCISAIYLRQSVRCAVNPRTGLEYRDPDPSISEPNTGPRHMVVIGGGPGGMEAARRLDLAGHRVTLLEQGNRLGGTLFLASLAYAANERLLNWLTRQLAASRVQIRLDTPATPDLIARLRPDAVIVATGAVRSMPPIPGSDLPHVFSGDDMRRLLLGSAGAMTKRRLGAGKAAAVRLAAALGLTSNLGLIRRTTRTWMPFGKNIVIIGGELVGLELAEFLGERKRRVSIVDEPPVMGAGLAYVRRIRLLTELREHGVQMFPAAANLRIDRHAVLFTDSDGGAREISADQVIVAKGATGDTQLADTLRRAGFNVRAIGDCTGVGYIEGAMRTAAEAVRELLA
ncbi:NADH:flavin oxidoreductase [Steroidobacter denitrificans]|uniref:NADH:flavin oxidoreductase n=1 Tax=Steroidobacter denitrificans TaxID=465721 RepID=A0A127F724_STEDE|nr:FAD-dependent oxidoreductase [Steroidobacter denitrificans]AMN46243.1 NADH:flavin oxidoreductase [Steroidobacter denitrificans]